ncbi:hypothetical protein [Cobetia crustatorum]
MASSHARRRSFSNRRRLAVESRST